MPVSEVNSLSQYLQWNVAACLTSYLSVSVSAVEYSSLSHGLTQCLSSSRSGM
jgi:hypothetical protein